MNATTNRILMSVAATILTIALLAGVVDASNANRARISKPSLQNVRDYAAAVADKTYAVEGGVLFVGGPQGWVEVATPDEIIVGAVAIDPQHPETIYVGAANTLAVYRSPDGGQHWLRVPLSEEYIGGVTDIAVDSDQRLVYVGTDTAGLFRLRDVGSSVIVGGHQLLDEPVLQVVADSSGTGMAFARTAWHLYRAENYGLHWLTVENLLSTPTALALANTRPATLYVGTVDRGVLKSHDGLTWTRANAGLGEVPGSRLAVDALAVDPLQPELLYIALSYLYGSTTVHSTAIGVAMSTDGAQSWGWLDDKATVGAARVTELLPVSGEQGAVYALTTHSRTPLPLGRATAAVISQGRPLGDPTTLLAWIVAALAALTLIWAILKDLRRRSAASLGGSSYY